jgi:hypothetical protein
MGSEAEIRKYVKHELTHLGLRISLGKKIEPIYKTLYDKYKNSETGKAIVSNYFPDGFHPEEYWNHKITFVDEVLAKLGEANVDPGFFQRMVARIKVMLNSRFPGMKFTDKDVRAMIANAHRDAEKFGKKLEDLPEGHQLQYDADTRKWAVLNEKGETVNEDADRTKAIAFAKKSRDEVDPTEKYHDPEAEKAGKAAGVRYTGSMKADPEHGIPEDQHWYNDDNAKTPTGFFIKAGEDLKAKRDESRARNEAQERKKQTETPEFKKWFGDSKVVDEKGEPLVVYHGTNKDFKEFKTDKKQSNFNAMIADGFYFTENPKYASGYAVGDGANIKQAYLNVKNPLIVKSVPEYKRAMSEAKGKLSKGSKYAEAQLLSKSDSEVLAASGYDGVIYKPDAKMSEIVVFEPNQIKSATGNRGTFDPNNPDIRFAKKEPTFGEGNDASKIPGYRGDRNVQRKGDTPEEEWRKRTANAEDKAREDASRTAREKETDKEADQGERFQIRGDTPEEALESIPETPKRMMSPWILKTSNDIKALGKTIKEAAIDMYGDEGKYGPGKELLLWLDGTMQQGFYKSRSAVDYIKKFVPDKARRNAISMYREFGGDEDALREQAARSSKKNAGKYELAIQLTDTEKDIAKKLSQMYDLLWKLGEQWGILDGFRKNYLTHVIKGVNLPDFKVDKMIETSGKLKRKFQFNHDAQYPTIAALENEGYSVESADAADLMGVYIAEMEKVICTKKFIKRLSETKGKDGNPLAAVEEGGVPQRQPEKDPNQTEMPNLVEPPKDEDKVDYSKYKSIDNQALSKWTWMKNGETGKRTLYQGQMMLSPEIYKQVKRVLSTSAIRNWYEGESRGLEKLAKGAVKRLDSTQSAVKQWMFIGSGFHETQEKTHMAFHRLNPFAKMEPIDLENNQEQIRSVNHGLRLEGHYSAMSAFMENFGTGASVAKIPGFGKLQEAYSQRLFTRVIPQIKWATYKAVLERNLKTYAKELASGKVSKDYVEYQTAKQVNASYGHVNFADLGMNATFKHFLQLISVAPDFELARGYFTAQAIKGALGAKSGREQIKTFMTGLVATLAIPAIINKLTTGDWHLKDAPFKIVVGKRQYGLRSHPEDLYRLVANTSQFLRGRANPSTVRPLEWFFTRHDYRGAPESGMQYLEEFLFRRVPIGMRGLVAKVPGLENTGGNKDLNMYDMALNAMGIQVSRYSPLTKVYQLADDWKEKNKPDEQKLQYPPSKFRDLRNAVQDGNEDEVFSQWDKLKKETKLKNTELKEYFKKSMFHPFAGSAKAEKEFKHSLNEGDRQVYDAAIQDRNRYWQNFNKMMGEKPSTPIIEPPKPKAPADTSQTQEGAPQ